MENKSKEEVAREVEQTRLDAKRAVKNATDVWSGKNAVASAWRSTKGTVHRAQDRVAESAHATDELVRGNVYSALGIALGIGAVIGYFFTDKPRSSKKRKC